MSSIPLQRSKKLLEQDGWSVDKCEYWNQWSGQRRDLFHLADLAAIHENFIGTTYIQCCGEDLQEHVRKVMEGYEVKSGKHKGEIIPPNPHLYKLLKAQNKFLIWGWRLRKHEGTKDTWQLREIEFLIKDGVVSAYENKTELEKEPK